MIIINLLLILILSFSSVNLVSSKEELQNKRLQLVNINNNNLRNSIKAEELENLVNLSKDNGYVKEDSLDMNNYFLNDLNNAGLVITTGNHIKRDLDYQLIEGYGDKYSINKLFIIISKKYNLAFEILEFKIWPEANVFQFSIKFKLNKSNWIGKDPGPGLMKFNANKQNQHEKGFSGDRYYYQNQSGLNEDLDIKDLDITGPPEYVKFKGFINSQNNIFYLIELYDKPFIFKLNEEQIIEDIKYKIYYNNGLLLIENFKVYKIGEE